MTIIIFIVILVVLILVHEFGHFLVAKRAGIRVDEFGLGYPPRIWGKKIGGTIYSINWLPFGGFVKIFGEDLEDEAKTGPESANSFALKSKWTQVVVLIAGISMNLIFAWLILSFGYMAGTAASVDSGYKVSDPHLEIVLVEQDSPAAKAGLQVGDQIISVSAPSGELANPTPDNVPPFVRDHQNEPITVQYTENGAHKSATMTPAPGIVEGTKAIGISMDDIGTVHLPFFQALWQGLKETWYLLEAIVAGLWMLIHDAFQGHSDLSEITGPVGIANLVGQARQLGTSYLLSFTAFISINLAIVNLIPFPALDGGRILFVIIEAFRRKPISARVAGVANMIGFALLITLMVVVTFHDIWRLAH